MSIATVRLRQSVFIFVTLLRRKWIGDPRMRTQIDGEIAIALGPGRRGSLDFDRWRLTRLDLNGDARVSALPDSDFAHPDPGVQFDVRLRRWRLGRYQLQNCEGQRHACPTAQPLGSSDFFTGTYQYTLLG